jgi:hypothetical protein
LVWKKIAVVFGLSLLKILLRSPAEMKGISQERKRIPSASLVARPV